MGNSSIKIELARYLPMKKQIVIICVVTNWKSDFCYHIVFPFSLYKMVLLHLHGNTLWLDQISSISLSGALPPYHSDCTTWFAGRNPHFIISFPYWERIGFLWLWFFPAELNRCLMTELRRKFNNILRLELTGILCVMFVVLLLVPAMNASFYL